MVNGLDLWKIRRSNVWKPGKRRSVLDRVRCVTLVGPLWSGRRIAERGCAPGAQGPSGHARRSRPLSLAGGSRL